VKAPSGRAMGSSKKGECKPATSRKTLFLRVMEDARRGRGKTPRDHRSKKDRDLFGKGEKETGKSNPGESLGECTLKEENSSRERRVAETMTGSGNK